MPSAIDIIQWVYSQADPAHIEELLQSNEARLTVIVASRSGQILFRSDSADRVVSLNASGAIACDSRLAPEGTLYRAACAVLASEFAGAPSVLVRVPVGDGGEWLVVACQGDWDGEASACMLVGRTEPHSPDGDHAITATTIATPPGKYRVAVHGQSCVAVEVQRCPHSVSSDHQVAGS